MSAAKIRQEPLEDFIYILLQNKKLPFGKKLDRLFTRLDGIDLLIETPDACRALGQALVGRFNAEPEFVWQRYQIPVATTQLWLQGYEQGAPVERAIIMGLVEGLAERTTRFPPVFKNVTPQPSRPADQVTMLFTTKRTPD